MEELEDIPEYMVDDLRDHGYSEGKLVSIARTYGIESVSELWRTCCTDRGDVINAKRISRIA